MGGSDQWGTLQWQRINTKKNPLEEALTLHAR